MRWKLANLLIAVLITVPRLFFQRQTALNSRPANMHRIKLEGLHYPSPATHSRPRGWTKLMKDGLITIDWGSQKKASLEKIAGKRDQANPQRDEHVWTIVQDFSIFGVEIPSGYVKIAIENGYRNSEFSH